MKTRTNVKFGAIAQQHNQTTGIAVKTRVKSGAIGKNHRDMKTPLFRAVAAILVLSVGGMSTPTVDDQYSRDLKSITTVVGDLSSIYSGAKTAVEVGQFLLTSIGWIQADASTASLIANLKADVDQKASDIDWHFVKIAITDLMAKAQNTLETITDDPSHQIIWDDNTEHDSRDAVDTLLEGGIDNPYFYRMFRTADQDLLNKLNLAGAAVFTKADLDPMSDNSDFVYDWRLGLPALMTTIAYRIQILANCRPDFRTDPQLMARLAYYRGILMQHYNRMVKGIKCSPYANFCVDLHTGLYHTPDYPAPTSLGKPSGGLGRYSVYAAMPLYELKALIDLLYIYSMPSMPDLTENYHRIKSPYGPNQWCLAAKRAGLSSTASPVTVDSCDGNWSQWVYDRTKGTLVNSGTVNALASGGCLGLTGGPEPFSVGISQCNGSAAQKWTYDLETQRLIASNGTAMSVHWDQDQYPISTAAVGAPPTHTQEWIADPVYPGVTPYSNGLKPGEMLKKGESRVSRNNRFEVILQDDGNLVVYEKKRDNPAGESLSVLWASNTNGKPVADAVLQTDGDFAMYSTTTCVQKACTGGPGLPGPGPLAPATPVWHSATGGSPGAQLRLENTGDLAIYKDTKRLWGTMIFANIYVQDPNQAAYVSQSIPSTMVPGGKYNATVTIRNTGPQSWPVGAHYRLSLQGSQNIWGVTSVDLPVPVPSGATVTFAIAVTAPTTPGQYPFQWRMSQDGLGPFGDTTPLVLVPVSTPGTDDSRFVIQSVPCTTMTPGQSCDVSIRMRNGGTASWTAAGGYKLLSQGPQGNTQWGVINHREA